MKNNLIDEVCNVLKIADSKVRKDKVYTEINRAIALSYHHTGKHFLAKNIAKESIKKAKKVESTNCVIDFAIILRFYYSSIEANRNKAEYYEKVIEEYSKILQVELDISYFFSKYSLLLNTKKNWRY